MKHDLIVLVIFLLVAAAGGGLLLMGLTIVAPTADAGTPLSFLGAFAMALYMFWLLWLGSRLGNRLASRFAPRDQ